MSRWFLLLLLATQAAQAQTSPAANAAPPASAAAPTAPAAPAAAPALHTLTLEDLYSEIDVIDTAISPSGQYIAVVVRRNDADALFVLDVKTRKHQVIQAARHNQLGPALIARIATVYWKSDERLLFRIAVRPAEGKSILALSEGSIAKLGDRLFAINRDGSKAVALLGENRNLALQGAFDLGSIASFLPRDPTHILMVLDGFSGRSLFKVDLESGRGEQIERPQESVIGWWLDLEGNPVVRITTFGGTVSLFRKEKEKWIRFVKMRASEMRERPDYDLVGPSDQPGKYYVLARPAGRDRTGLYLYDLEKEAFGDPVVENPDYDLTSAQTSRDGKRVIHYCYVAHVEICEFSDPSIDSHMKGLRRYFKDSANLYVFATSEDGKSMLLFVEGPRNPPAYYYYVTDDRQIESVGATQQAMNKVTLPDASVVGYAARDGKQLTGYLTLPANVPPNTRLALVLYPHGGPERRDQLTFDPWVQYLVARGYAVFQPNFRGSDGFGRAFAESGYGEWGRKMQDDLTDAVKALVDRGVADPARVCIIGASYGGYAALAGAALTPDLFKCAVSIAGISDLEDFIGWRKRNWGRESEGYTYWLKAIGDPDKDEQKLREVSPLQLVKNIKVPVLLIHGTDDPIVPIAQSRSMKRALDKAGHKTELIEIQHEGHSYWADANEMYALSNIDAFLWKHLGAGIGVTTPPVVRGAPKK